MASFAPSPTSPLATLVRSAERLIVTTPREGGLHIPAPECTCCGARLVKNGRCYYCETPVVGFVTKRLPIPTEGTPVLK
jgi:hypothetical protein